MLLVVSTPIGNLDEISQRALNAIKECDVIVCEDTRVSLKLLSYYGIKKKVIRYKEFSDRANEKIIEMAKQGKSICLISDAGTPCISDPGWRIVKLAIDNGIEVKVIGVNCANVAAVAGSGFDGSRFIFLGFLPRSESKMLRMLSLIHYGLPVVIYESPNRIVDLIRFVIKNFGEDIECVIARELTKLHEEWIRGRIGEVYNILLNKEIKGEITVVFSKPSNSTLRISRVGFVCSGNTCRSVLAHAYAMKIAQTKNLSIVFDSSGLCVREGSVVCDNALRLISEEGIENFSHIPKQIDRIFIETNDIILVMTKEHKRKILLLFPEYAYKVFTLNEYAGYSGDIYDPYGKDYIFYQLIFRQIKRSINAMIDIISSGSMKG